MKTSGIQNINFYQDPIGTSCDRCGTGIKNVVSLSFVDGTKIRVGTSCIEKILKQDNSLLSMFRKNSELIKKYNEALRVLSLPYEQMPKSHEYIPESKSGLYFISLDEGGWKTLSTNDGQLWHPLIDWERNQVASSYRQESKERWLSESLSSIEKAKTYYRLQIERTSKFLARNLGFVNPESIN